MGEGAMFKSIRATSASISLALLLGAVAANGMRPGLETTAKAGPARGPASATTAMWVSPLDFLAGDPSVQTQFNAVSSGVGSGLSGLVVTSSTTGDTATG